MDKKTRFLNYELWSLSINASFQRVNVYKAGNEKYVENKKANFQNYLLSMIEGIAESYQNQTISEEQQKDLDEASYKSIIEQARQKTNLQSLAEYELKQFNIR